MLRQQDVPAELPEIAISPQAGRILDIAERLVQTRGFNGFSYADVAAELGVTKASLHYHYASKADLGMALVNHYHRAMVTALQELDTSHSDVVRRLCGYVNIYEGVLRNERMCLCGMLAAEVSTLPAPLQQRVNEVFGVQELWVARVLEAGRKIRKFRFEGSARTQAQLLIGALEGAMLIARSYGDPKRLRQAAVHVMKVVGTGGRRPRQ